MKKLTSIFYAFLISFLFFLKPNIYGQIVLPDSIEDKLKEIKNESGQAEYLMQYALEIRETDHDLSIGIAKEVMKNAREKKDYANLARCHTYMGIVATANFQADSIKYHYNQILSLAEKHNLDRVFICAANRGLANYYLSIRDMDNAMEYIEEAQACYESEGDLRASNGLIIKKGTVASLKGELGVSISYYLEALKYLESINDIKSQSGLLINIASLHVAKLISILPWIIVNGL